MAKNFTERRRSPRAQGGFHIVVNAPQQRKKVLVRDISTSGVSCFLDFPIPEFTTVMVNLEIPESASGSIDHKGLTCEGAIVRCRPVGEKKSDSQFDVAIFFQNISDEGRRLIESYVAARRPAADPTH
jgi:hypothetical protein